VKLSSISRKILLKISSVPEGLDFLKELAPDLKRFEQEFRDYLWSGIFLIDQINRFIVKGQGKKLRPALSFLCAKMTGAMTDLTMKAALIVELLHTATLVHDDIVDSSDKRRGFPSVVRIWKSKVAVLYGDYLLAHSLTAMLEIRNMQVFDILSVTARRLAKGELLQAAKTRKLDITEDIYLRMIADKTAALIAAAAELGGLTGGGNAEQLKALRNYGENLGMAFQIKDDLLDFTGREGILGKPVGADIKERKITLPLIAALSKVDPRERERMLKQIKYKKKASRVIDFVRHSDGIEYAQEKAQFFAEAAKQYLTIFPNNQERQRLIQLADYAVRRDK